MAKRGPKTKAADGRMRKKSPPGRGKRGPAKTPVKKLKIHNSRLTKDRESSKSADSVIKFPSGTPQRPTWVMKTRHKIWDNLIALYKKTMPDILMEIDVYVLARYCDLSAWYLDLRRKIEKEGTTKERVNKIGIKYTAKNPNVTIVMSLATHLEKLEKELYLTPSARQGVVAPAKPKADSLAEYLSRGA